MPTAISARRVEWVCVAVEMAKRILERTQHLEDSGLVLTHSQWQIHELRRQVLELQMQLEKR